MPRLSILALPLAADSILMLAVTLSRRFNSGRVLMHVPPKASGDKRAA